MLNFIYLLKERKKSKRIKEIKKLLLDTMSILVAINGVNKDTMTETEKMFMIRAMRNIAISIGKLTMI